MERTKSQVSDPRVPVSVSVEATGRARRLTERRPDHIAGAEHGLEIRRSRHEPTRARFLQTGEPLQHRDQ